MSTLIKNNFNGENSSNQLSVEIKETPILKAHQPKKLA
jgi:hypothetical protein